MLHSGHYLIPELKYNNTITSIKTYKNKYAKSGLRVSLKRVEIRARIARGLYSHEIQSKTNNKKRYEL